MYGWDTCLVFNIQSRRQWWFIHSYQLTTFISQLQSSNHGLATEQRSYNVFVTLQKPNSDKGQTVFSAQDMQCRPRPGNETESIRGQEIDSHHVVCRGNSGICADRSREKCAFG